MHAVRRELVELQAEPGGASAVGRGSAVAVLQRRLRGADGGELPCRRAVEERIDALAFGDLFLRDIREYRERQLGGTDLDPLFPLWEIPTRDLANEMIASGIRAKINACVDPKARPVVCGAGFFRNEFLRDLPEEIDPCGENGEFHSFVYASPVFVRPLDVAVGEIVERDGFVFADVYRGPRP